MTDCDLFDNPMTRAAAASMSIEEKEKLKKLGEQMYGSVDFVKGTVPTTKPPIEDAVAYITLQLRSGMHPSMLEESEKQVMKTYHGSEWYKQWGYIEKDLDEIFTLKF